LTKIIASIEVCVNTHSAAEDSMLYTCAVTSVEMPLKLTDCCWQIDI